ncbi:hypothetical protein F5Y04DRAFT_277541 [Hypomontagnella monticulosa]|nr:hypothetical protein F5Y04DRAFT_277541 [Hypomontagnella monticulosa]
MSIWGRIRNNIKAAKDHISIMTHRDRILPTDFDLLYQLYHESTSSKGLYQFIIEHDITRNLADRFDMRPIDVLATMVGKTVDACQQELREETKMYESAKKR